MTDVEALGAIARGEKLPLTTVMHLWREGLIEIVEATHFALCHNVILPTNTVKKETLYAWGGSHRRQDTVFALSRRRNRAREEFRSARHLSCCLGIEPKISDCFVTV